MNHLEVTSAESHYITTDNMVFYNPFKKNQTQMDQYPLTDNLRDIKYKALKSTFYLDKINIFANRIKPKAKLEREPDNE